MNIQNGIKNLIIDSLDLLSSNDSILIVNRAREETINHRLAYYLEQLLVNYNINEHNVDVEYDKSLRDPKRMNGERIRPDITIHKRNSNDYNLLYIEAKKGYSTKKDKEKVRNSLQEPYLYQYSLLLSYNPTRQFFTLNFYDKSSLESTTIKHPKKY